jgi:hypothetical protein
MRGDGGIDQIAPQPAQPRQGSLLVGPGEPAASDQIRRKDGCEFPVDLDRLFCPDDLSRQRRN